MLEQYGPIFICIAFSVLFVTLSLLISRWLAPRMPDRLKAVPYECGETPVGSPFIRFNPRYYVFALAFLIFDVEIIFMLPCAAVFSDWVAQNMGLVALIEILTFASFLVLGLAYVWRQGDLVWVQTNVDDVPREKQS